MPTIRSFHTIPGITVVIALLSILAGVPVAAQEISVSGVIDTVQSLGLTDDYEVLDSRTRAIPTLEVSAESSRASVTARAEYNAAIPSRSGFELGEAWYEWASGPIALTLGQQIITWGAADGVTITDVICPHDMTAFSGLEYIDSRLPVDAVRIKLSQYNWDFDLIWIPVFTPTKLPIDTDNPLSEIAYPNTVTTQGYSLPVSYSIANSPHGIADGEYASRLSYSGSLLDVGICAFYGWDDLPRATKTLVVDSDSGQPTGISVSTDWYRIAMLGADTSVPVGPIVFRFEGAFTHDRYFAVDGLGESRVGASLKKNQIRGMAGLDWMPGDWTITAQYIEDAVLNYETNLARDQFENGATLNVSRTFLRDTLELSASGYLGLSNFDGYGNFSATYDIDDNFSLAAGTDLFWGGPDNDGDYESYEKLTSVFLKGTYRF